jgi:hypothetical protein
MFQTRIFIDSWRYIALPHPIQSTGRGSDKVVHTNDPESPPSYLAEHLSAYESLVVLSDRTAAFLRRRTPHSGTGYFLEADFLQVACVPGLLPRRAYSLRS